MSEIKGQLLGMILVIAIFAAISTVVVKMFKNEVNGISSQMSNIMEENLVIR
jgi:flagellar biogenesis protein FliO